MFGCIYSQGDEKGRCNFNSDNGACGYGKVIGIMAFAIIWLFLGLDALLDNISNVNYRRYIVLADIALSGWFATYNFCVMVYMACRC